MRPFAPGLAEALTHATPVLLGEWVRPGTHVNAVGSSFAGPVEVDGALVARSRYFVEYRRCALAAVAEFLATRAAGLVGDNHIVAEIGAVFAGHAPGRTSADDITFYKSLRHIAKIWRRCAICWRRVRAREQ